MIVIDSQAKGEHYQFLELVRKALDVRTEEPGTISMITLHGGGCRVFFKTNKGVVASEQSQQDMRSWDKRIVVGRIATELADRTRASKGRRHTDQPQRGNDDRVHPHGRSA